MEVLIVIHQTMKTKTLVNNIYNAIYALYHLITIVFFPEEDNKHLARRALHDELPSTDTDADMNMEVDEADAEADAEPAPSTATKTEETESAASQTETEAKAN